MGRNKYILHASFPDIYVEKTGNKWQYSAHTIQEIDRIHQEVYPWGTAQLLNYFPINKGKRIFGLYTWQLGGLAFLGIAGFLLYFVLSFVFRIIIRNIAKNKTGANYSHEIKSVARPLSMWVVAMILNVLINILQLPVVSLMGFNFIFKIVIPVLGILVLYNLADLLAFIGISLASRTENHLDNQLIPLLKRTAKVVIVVLGIIHTLQNLSINVTTLLAGISIGGLALALAAQDSVKNFLGSLTILLDETFLLGDFIEFDGKSGVVEEVGFRSTRIRTPEGMLISIPNAKIADTAVINNGTRKFRKFQPKLIFDANQNTQNIADFVADLQSFVDKNPQTHNAGNKIYLSQLNAKNMEVHASILFDDAMVNEATLRQEMILYILGLAKKHQLEFV